MAADKDPTGVAEETTTFLQYGPACEDDCPCRSGQHVQQLSGVSLFHRLSFVDRFLSVWILVTMVIGLLVGYFAPWVGDALRSVTVGSVSLPVALGLILMLLPVFAKVPYERLGKVVREAGLTKQLGVSTLLNWVVGPLVMTAFAWATLPDLPHYRNGVILVGLARCIAMVLLWNSLANGSTEYCAILVSFNACLQLLLYSPMAVLFINYLSTPEAASVAGGSIPNFFWTVAQGVLVFMGIPFALGVLLRFGLRFLAGVRWFDQSFVPWFSPVALLGLLYTIFVLFAAQGEGIVEQIGPVARVSVPMLLYFATMFTLTLGIAYYMRFPYELAVTQAFTASSNNFELAIAIAVATFGVTSPEALAAVVGPLIEVPVLLGLVSVALRLEVWWKRRLCIENDRSSSTNEMRWVSDDLTRTF